VVLGWIGAMRFTADGASALAQTLTQHVIVGALLNESAAIAVAHAIGAIQLIAVLLLVVGTRVKPASVAGSAVAFVLTAVPITMLLTNPVWMERLGGFPAIGSGQGIIKYPALAGIALFLYAVEAGRPPLRRYATTVMVCGVMLPLLWIGAMKFTAPEAAGVEPLLLSSPFMSWMPRVFGTQGASNLIGITELLTVAVLASWWYRPRWYVGGALLTTLTFLTTLSFLVTFPGWHADLGFPVLSGTGIFIVKDLGLMMAAIIPLANQS
jgi:reactive chlorine resistance protein C